jgi:transcriptional regulator with XRE-family HTH domain
LKVRLTLQEKLRNLRDEKKLTLTALSEATGVPTATLQRPGGRTFTRDRLEKQMQDTINSN